MSSSKYRLATPIEHSPLAGSHRFDSPRVLTASRRPTTVYDAKTNRTTVLLLDDTQTPSITRPRWWLVLPTLLLSTFASATDLLLINDFLTHRYETRYGLDASHNAERAACRQSTTSTTMAIPYWQFPPFAQQLPASQNRLDYSLVQRDTANFNIKNSFATLIPGLIMLTLLGSNCDLIGRRPVMLLPYIGKVLRYTLQLIIISLNLSDVWLLAAHALEATFGSHGLITLSAFAYITDCTNDSSRTRAFLLTEVSIIITRIVPMVLMSFLLRRSLYILPTSISLALSVIGVAYVILVQPESTDSVRHVFIIRQLARIRLPPIIRTITVFFVKRPGTKQQHLVLITLITILIVFMTSGPSSVRTLYLYGHPFCMDAVNVSLLMSSQSILAFVLSLLASCVKKKLDANFLLPIVGLMALASEFVILGLAKTVWPLYIAVCIGSLFFITMPVLRTKLTRAVEKNEYAIVFIGASIIEMIGTHAIGAAANGIYRASLRFFSGLVFIVFALTGIFPMAIMGYLVFSERKQPATATSTASPGSDAKVFHKQGKPSLTS